MPANHLDNKTAVGLIRLILDVTFAAFNSRVLVLLIAQTALEDGKKSLSGIQYDIEEYKSPLELTLLYSWHVKRASVSSEACRALGCGALKVYFSKKSL